VVIHLPMLLSKWECPFRMRNANHRQRCSGKRTSKISDMTLEFSDVYSCKVQCCWVAVSALMNPSNRLS
jgi:hypothetical protein